MSLQTDGRIALGGAFAAVGGTSRNRIARVNSNGTLDTGFNPGANDIVRSLVLQPDGRLLAGGAFTSIGGIARERIALLDAAGGLVESFNPGANGSSVYSLLQQTDGKLLVGGEFTTLGGEPRQRLARLNADGSVDDTFNPGANGSVYGLAMEDGGGIIATGDFTGISGASRNRIARLHNDTATRQFAVTATNRIEWLRGGASPEASGVEFHLDAGDGNWTPLGSGSRIPGGWELTGVQLPKEGRIRARARTASGVYASSTGLLESVYDYEGALTPFEIWAFSHGLDPETDGAMGEDADRDGLTNFFEYAFGLDPADGSSINPYASGLEADGTLSYTRRDPALTGLTYKVFTSTDLSDWAEDTAAVQIPGPVSTGGVQTVAVTLSAAPAGGRLFSRIVATR